MVEINCWTVDEEHCEMIVQPLHATLVQKLGLV